MPRVREAALAALVLLVSAASAFADRLRVPQDFATVQEAVDAAGPGDVILVKGTIAGQVDLTGKSGLTIRGSRRASLDAAGAYDNLRMSGCTDITLSRLGLVDSGGSSMGVSITNCVRITFDRCTLRDSGALEINDGREVRVVRCSVQGANLTAINLNSLTEDAATTSDCLIERCTVTDPQAQVAIFVEGTRQSVRRNRVGGEALGAQFGIWLLGSSAQCDVSRNTIDPVVEWGIRAAGTGHVLDGNVVRGTLPHGGISLYGTGHTVRRSRVSDTSPGVETAPGSSACTIAENRVARAPGYGVRVDGSGHTVQGNVVSRSEQEGIVVVGSGHLIDRNAVERTGEDGIWIDADGVSCSLNRVRESAQNGIFVDGDLCSIAANGVERAALYGFVAARGGSNFNGNRSRKSGLGGFLDAPGGGNVVVDNDFR